MMESTALRQAFVDYFRDREHQVLASSALVPDNDPTLLFTNAGMVQFKEIFAGRERPAWRRAVTVQKCLRAGGKHNDLDNVGHTLRHHTFFEMLGNFSFGDYFKEAAVVQAWEFVTRILAIPASRLWFTVHEQDTESFGLWRRLGVPAGRILQFGDADNFWAMGDTGPCGHCAEIFYDHGVDLPGGLPGTDAADGERYTEIWNLVFMEYDRGSDGVLLPLASKGVDTGMGLERIAAIMQGTADNYRTDVFAPLFGKIAEVAGLSGEQAVTDTAARVIADHLRAAGFLIAEDVRPANEGRGYVLRRIIRRALRHGYKLDIREAFLARLVPLLVRQMGGTYPELNDAAAHIEQVLSREETQFGRTLEKGLVLLDREMANLSARVIPGELVFKLYDTYGFPVDLTADHARERGLALDMEGFAEAMRGQRERARAGHRFKDSVHLSVKGSTNFVGYRQTEAKTCVNGLFRGASGAMTTVGRLHAGESGALVLDETPFYAEAGGQTGDTGRVLAQGAEFIVTDTRPQGDVHVHYGQVAAGTFSPGMDVEARIDVERRHRIRCNHSATHLLNAALQRVLGEHVEQRGSLVAEDRLRFDFHHPSKVGADELCRIEAMVNDEIQRNTRITTKIMSAEEAHRCGARSLSGERYGERVRVLSMGDGFSLEFCGGTHAGRTGDVGIFRIVSESAVAVGTRRIEAVTGQAARMVIDADAGLLGELQKLLQCRRGDLVPRVEALLRERRKMEKNLVRLQAEMASGKHSGSDDGIQEHDGIKLVARQMDGMNVRNMLVALDELKVRLGSAVIVLGGITDDRVSLVAGVSDDLCERLSAVDLLGYVGSQVGARGGGRPGLARGGGGDRPEALPAALDSVSGYVRQRLA